MSPKKSTTSSKQTKSQPAKTKEQIVADLKAYIQANPEEAKQPIIGAGSRTYSIEQLLHEIENDTKLGKTLLEGWLLASSRKS